MYTGAELGTVTRDPRCGAIGPAVTQRSDCSVLGPEWQYIGPGGNNECKFKVGGVSYPGTHAKCRKIQYLGDKAACCLGLQPPGYPTISCNPEYTSTSSTCNEILSENCSIEDRVFSDEKCAKWQLRNPDMAFQLKRSYCTDDRIRTNAYCRSWVMNEAQGRIDDIMQLKFCQKYPTDPLCVCVMSPIPCPNKFDQKCSSFGGYRTRDMITTTCPNVINCTQLIGVDPDAIVVGTDITQRCAAELGTAPKPQPPTPEPTPASIWFIMFVMFVVLVVLAGIIGRRIWLRKKEAMRT